MIKAVGKTAGLFLSVLAALLCNGILCSCKDGGDAKSDGYPGYKLVWSDEFDGQALNADYWECMIGNGSDYGISDWGNNELQYYRAENASVESGNLIITARRESAGGKDYTSARLRTAGKVSAKYGRIEARISLPAGQGLWPAFWMLPESSTPYGAWPYSGEIDIMEARGRLTNMMSGALHYGGPNDVYVSNTWEFKNSTIEDYHVYAIEWNEDALDWYADDDCFMHIESKRWFSMADESNPSAPFDTDFHILLNLAVGGNFDGGAAPDGNFASAQMKVDYVRIYERES